jgi:hypothetical protein
MSEPGSVGAASEQTQARVTYIARCPEHGLHGERDECFVCGGEVEQVPFVPLDPPSGQAVVESAQQIRDVALLFPAGSPTRLSLRAALDALLADLAESERNVELLRGGYEVVLADFAAAEARAERLQEALGFIELEDEGEEYELPDWEVVQAMPQEFRAPCIARAALAAVEGEQQTEQPI